MLVRPKSNYNLYISIIDEFIGKPIDKTSLPMGEIIDN